MQLHHMERFRAAAANERAQFLKWLTEHHSHLALHYQSNVDPPLIKNGKMTINNHNIQYEARQQMIKVLKEYYDTVRTVVNSE